MNSKELREIFLKFFEERGHKILPSASLVPENDPSVLFTTAGMQQFKRYYLNPDEAPAAKVATSQKCLRIIDIDEVGDKTHNTFFEMLGNFSFNDYFKKEAIELAWEFLTEELKIDKARIHATYFQSENDIPTDEESKNILESIEGLKEIKSQGFSDNFWSLGTDDSPGGPTVEFYIDGVEVWNLVFNEYVFHTGKYEPSNLKGVDTGMGFERLLMSMNDKDEIYKTDLFKNMISEVERLSGLKYGDKTDEEYIKDDKQCWIDVRKQFRVVVDHIRSSVFAINDGVLPSNKDAGYVVRRLIRRAIVKAKQLGIEKEFIKEIAVEVFKVYDGVYFDCHSGLDPESIMEELQKEEEKFRATLERGLKVFQNQKAELNGKVAFDLYQTYGFPWEMTVELAQQENIRIDKNEFEIEFKQHQDLSRTASAGMFKGGLQSGGEMETKYHTATHLLLASLRQILGGDINQKGSNITAERLRFDFNFPKKLTEDQIKEVEDLVNENIKKDLVVEMSQMSLEDARNCDATGVFENKYGDKVNVYNIGEVSKEICGGPHAKSTGELGHFKIIKEESSSSGIRRIKAILE